MIPKKVVIGLFILCSFFGYSQDNTTKKDTIITAYKNIENYSKKSRFTKFVHGLVFRTVQTKPTVNKHAKRNQRKSFQNYENKIIRNIEITTLDPFGYSTSDTAAKPSRFMSKLGNTLHAKTKKFIIKDLLLIKKGDRLDTLLVYESERIIRSQRYIRRVQIEPQMISAKSDSVDVIIRVLDSWSLIPNITPTTSRVTYEVRERNFLGLGHDWSNSFRQNIDDSKSALSTRYTLPNIKNTFIRATLNYQIDLQDNYTKGIQVERTFISPYTRWAGGFQYENRFLQDSLPTLPNQYKKENFKTDTYDAWIGYSMPVNIGNGNFSKQTNLITTLRLLNIDFIEKPSIESDSINFFSDEKFILSGIGISHRSFVQDSYIFNYGITEDVPIGKYFGATAGYQRKNEGSRLYMGLRATLGNYFSWGYLSTNFEFGSFYRDKSTEQNTFVSQLNYFTPLIEMGRWKMRHFIKNDIIIGNNRLNSEGDRLNINESNGIQGFNSPKSLGTKKIVLSLQSQTYSPWQWAGFRFSPFSSYSLALLGDGANGFKKSEGFNKFTLGVILTNDYLVFNNFQLSFSFYPKIPNQGENIFNTNSFQTSDFGYLDFEINKPRTATYN